MHYACRDILLKPMTFAGPNNYLQVPGFFRKPKMFVKFKFRSWDYTGLLMFTRFADDLGALELGLSEGQINVTIFQPGKKKLQFAAGGLLQSMSLSDMTEKIELKDFGTQNALCFITQDECDVLCMSSYC